MFASIHNHIFKNTQKHAIFFGFLDKGINKGISVKKMFLNLKHCFWERTNNLFFLLTGSQTRTYLDNQRQRCLYTGSVNYILLLNWTWPFFVIKSETQPIFTNGWNTDDLYNAHSSWFIVVKSSSSSMNYTYFVVLSDFELTLPFFRTDFKFIGKVESHTNILLKSLVLAHFTWFFPKNQ